MECSKNGGGGGELYVCVCVILLSFFFRPRRAHQIFPMLLRFEHLYGVNQDPKSRSNPVHLDVFKILSRYINPSNASMVEKTLNMNQGTLVGSDIRIVRD